MEDLQSISDSSDTWALHLLHVGFILFPSIISASKYTENRVDAFWTPPSCPRHGSAGPPPMQAAGFIVNYAQRCLHQHARSRGRPPAPPHRRRTLCKNVQNFVSLRVIGTHGPRPWCCRETGVRRGDGGWGQSCKDGDKMCDGEEIASWTLD